MVLSACRSTLAVQESGAVQLSSIQAEVARLESHPQPVNICRLVRRAQETVAMLAAQRQICLYTDLPQEPVVILTDPMVAEQVLVSALSHAIGQALSGDLHVQLTVGEEQSTLSLRYFPEQGTATPFPIDLVITSLADRLEWHVEQKDRPDGARIIMFTIPRRGAVVLVIDDNEGLITLVKRYLTGYACRVVSATDSQEGLHLAQELLPNAIMLDVMMPEISGWEVLQRLRNHPKTANIPIIVCSVLNNPELAYSLGASCFLPKPVSRGDVLSALHKLGAV